jgi:CheY-like chemotaxis protein
MSNSILIVDDERGIRETLRGVLEDEGFEVEAVESGEACLKTVEESNFACILLDVWLPEIDGLETLKRLREQGNDAAVGDDFRSRQYRNSRQRNKARRLRFYRKAAFNRKNDSHHQKRH